MSRSLIKHAVHPSYTISNPKTSNWRIRNYIIPGIIIMAVILFCDGLFHSNDPHSTTTNNITSSYLPIQIQGNPSNPEPDNSLEQILRPIQSSVASNKQTSTKQPKHLLIASDENTFTSLQTSKIERREQRNPEEILIENNQLNQIRDYWDFPISSQSKPAETSSVQHQGEYEMHNARKEWFQSNYIDKDKQIHPESNLIKDFTTRCPVYTSTKQCKWTPPLESLCNWSNNAIFWHSMHGTMIGRDFRNANPPNHFMWKFAEELNASQSCECPQNVAFVFADNMKKDMRLIERSYRLCNDNCHFFHVAQDYHPWDWFGKIGPLLTLINTEEFQSKFEYVVLTDADDQTLIQSPIDIIEAFEFYNASIVVGGEATSYPNWQGNEKGFENAVYPWSRHHQHLNAGGFMGKIVKMIPYLEYMQRDYNNFTIERAEEIKEKGRNFWRDQTVWRNMHLRFYPDIKIDSLAKLWTRTDIYMYDL